jgi:hypothetical protein
MRAEDIDYDQLEDHLIDKAGRPLEGPLGGCRYSYTCRKRARRHEFSLLPVEIFLYL